MSLWPERPPEPTKIRLSRNEIAKIRPIIRTQRLPPNVIQEIFIYALRDMYCDTTLPTITLDTRHAMWSFTHVCRSWRRAALAGPYFWENLQLDVLRDPTPWTYDMIKTLLERSKNRDLILNVQIHSDNSIAQDIAKLLLNQGSRWKKVALHLSPSLYPLFVDLNLPVLEQFTIAVRDAKVTSVAAPTIKKSALKDCFTPASWPKLWFVDLSGLYVCGRIDKLHLPWSQLTHLRIIIWTLTDICKFLNNLPNLTNLTIRDPFGLVRGGADDPAPKPRPNIRYLFVGEGSYNVYRFLNLPNLTHVRFLGKPASWDPLRQMVSLSRCKIDTLTLDFHPAETRVSERDFFRFFYWVETVIFLRLPLRLLVDEVKLAMPVFGSATYHEHRVYPPMFPRLRRIFFEPAFFLEPEYNWLLEAHIFFNHLALYRYKYPLVSAIDEIGIFGQLPKSTYKHKVQDLKEEIKTAEELRDQFNAELAKVATNFFISGAPRVGVGTLYTYRPGDPELLDRTEPVWSFQMHFHL